MVVIDMVIVEARKKAYLIVKIIYNLYHLSAFGRRKLQIYASY
jgi:hypothetical protein